MSRTRLLLSVAVALAPLAGSCALYRLSDELLRPPRPRLGQPRPPLPPAPATGGGSGSGTMPPPSLPASPAELDLPFRDVSFPGWGGVTARGWYVPAAEKARGSVVILHGNASNRQAGLPLAPMLHEAGFAVLLFDFTGRGDSDGEMCTYGFHETEDARQAARLAASLLPGKPVALVGRSLGAAVALLAAAAPQGAPVDAVVADSPYASLADLVSARRAELWIPAWPFEPLYYAIIRWRAGFDPRDIEVAARARAIRVPVLLLHGTDDRDIPIEHSCRIEAALSGPHRLVPIPGVGHNDRRPASVSETIRSFLIEELPRAGVVEL